MVVPDELARRTDVQCWGIIYLILNILNKYRIIIIIRRLQYLFIHIIRKIAGNILQYIPISLTVTVAQLRA